MNQNASTFRRLSVLQSLRRRLCWAAATLVSLNAAPMAARDLDCKPDVMRVDKITKKRQELWVQVASATSFGASLFSSSETRVFVTAGRSGVARAIRIEIYKKEKSGAVAAFESMLLGAKGRSFVFGFRDGGEPLSFVITDVINQTKVDQGVLGTGDIATTVVLSASLSNSALVAMRETLTSRQIDAVRVELAGDNGMESSIDEKNGRRLMQKFACFYQALDKDGALSGPDEPPQSTASASTQRDGGAPAPLVTSPQPRTGSEVTVDQIVQLVKAKVADDVIVTMLQTSRLKSEATTDDLIKLKSAGASSDVMRAVVGAGAKAPAQQAISQAATSATPLPMRPGGAGKTQAPTSRLEATVPFTTGKIQALELVEGPVSINSVEVTSWPSSDKLRKAEAKDNTGKITVRFNYSNPDDRDWSCVYHVTVLDEKGQEIGSGERKAELEKRNVSDSNDVSVKVQASEFGSAATLRIKVEPRPD